MHKIMKMSARLFVVLVIAVSMVLGIAGCGTSEPAGTTGTDTGTGTALTITKGAETVSYTLAQVKAMTAKEGWGGIMNSSGVISGPFKQKGVPMADLLDKVGGMSGSDAVRPDGQREFHHAGLLFR
jgi:hypothetical protein